MTNLVSNHNRSQGRQRRAYTRVAAELSDGDAATFPSDLADFDRLAPADRAAAYLADVGVPRRRGGPGP